MIAPDLMQQLVQPNRILDLFRPVRVWPLCVMCCRAIRRCDEMDNGSVPLAVVLALRSGEREELILRPAAIQPVGKRVQRAPVA